MRFLVDEASKGKKLYVPAFRGKPDYLKICIEDGQPWAEKMLLDYTVNGTKVYVVYTDAEVAEYAAELCRQASADEKLYPAKLLSQEDEILLRIGFQPEITAKALTVDLGAVLEKANCNCLAVNPGLSSQMILPPDITHTAFMLLLEHQGTKLANTDYNEWINLVNGCLASDEAKEPGIQEFSVPEAKMSIGFKPWNTGDGKVIYEIIPQQ